jgi:hypothetical protein
MTSLTDAIASVNAKSKTPDAAIARSLISDIENSFITLPLAQAWSHKRWRKCRYCRAELNSDGKRLGAMLDRELLAFHRRIGASPHG